MDSISLIEFYLWVLQKESAKSLVTAKSVSNFIVSLYVLSYIINRKSCFLVAFFIAELVGVLSIYETIGLQYRYIAYSMVYSSMYWYLHKSGYSLRILSGYVIMLIFQITAAADAYIYTEVETYIYILYEYFIMAIHIYIISTVIDRKVFFRDVGCFFRFLRGFLSVCYCVPFRYNVIKYIHKTKSK